MWNLEEKFEHKGKLGHKVHIVKLRHGRKQKLVREGRHSHKGKLR